MLKSIIQVETRREAAFGTAVVTVVSVVLSLAITYVSLRGSDEAFVWYGLLVAFIVPVIVAPLSSFAIFDVLRENFLLNKELKLAAKVAERLAVAEAGASARQAANEALQAELAERRRVESKLRETNEALQTANAVKSRFLATINREIRAPMVDILDLIDALGASDLSDQQAAPLADLKRRSFALFTTLNDTLDLSLLEAGEVELQAREFDLAACVEDCVEVFAEEAFRKGVDIALNVAPSVPWRVRGDEPRLRQVLENLIGNAVKFTHRGRISVTVSASAEIAGRIRFEVADTGIGFSDESKSVLFEAFGVPRASEKFGGAGLGLAITQHLVHLMNGKLSIDSQPGKGAVVSFTAAFGAVESDRVEEQAPCLRDVKVFLATSRSSTRHQIGTYLAKAGASYQTAASPADVLIGLRQGTASRNPFDAVILDMGNGNAELARSIQEYAAFSRMRVIALTSGPDESAGGVSHTLTKPVMPSQLFEAIVGVTEGRRTARA